MRRRLLLLVATGLLSVTPPAGAAVRMGARRIIVTGNGAVAVVQRHPFRLMISAPDGRTALAEVADPEATADPLAPTADPIAPGYEPAASGQQYAPLSFLVGSASLTQYDGGLWGGDLKSGIESGTQYSAREVLSARAAGSGVTLTVSTDDPSGRTLRVTVSPDGRGLIRVGATPIPATGVASMSDAFVSAPSEAFYGFGGRHDALDQHGQDLASFVEEENIVGDGAAGTPAGSLAPGGPTAAYYDEAEFVSSRGYGFLLAQPQLARFRLDSDRPSAWSVNVLARSLSYLVAPGGPRAAIADLTAVSGRQPAPPAWALGPMMDRLIKNAGETDADYEHELRQDMVNITRYHLPLTAYRIEGWGFANATNDGLALHTYVSPALQAKIIRTLRARQIHPLAYLRPWITPGSAPDRADLTVRDATGHTYLTTGTAGQPIALLDFTNPAAVRFWTREVARVANLGFDGFMADFGEEVVAGMRFHDGATGATMHNRYPVLYMRATRLAVDAYERSHPGRRLWFFNRAGYSGTPGSAAYEGANFPGDEATNWSQASGLASSTEDMLSRAIGGAYGFGTDIGGYFDLTTPPTTKELFLRWAEWAALSPVFRLHGSGIAGTHTPWSYDAQTVRAYDALSKLHEQAAPLILRLWKAADRTGIPPVRPLWVEFPGDPRAAAQQQEWTLGDDVLVAPVVVRGARARSVYFPSGCWRSPVSGRVYRGRRSAVVSAPVTVLPYFFRCGTRPF